MGGERTQKREPESRRLRGEKDTRTRSAPAWVPARDAKHVPAPVLYVSMFDLAMYGISSHPVLLWTLLKRSSAVLTCELLLLQMHGDSSSGLCPVGCQSPGRKWCSLQVLQLGKQQMTETPFFSGIPPD
ncbi:hypothetical protein DV515_00005936 [Chloebia gouldiae]|uniref:Uncharacterized protein n=1 Tax=Chloebia gouldiae TaxID=44316 RepID=A0A3L8SNC9_CHLGU|nr:hypothetical protein DV515_00005936 [Chloebia gouldiae]